MPRGSTKGQCRSSNRRCQQQAAGLGGQVTAAGSRRGAGRRRGEPAGREAGKRPSSKTGQVKLLLPEQLPTYGTRLLLPRQEEATASRDGPSDTRGAGRRRPFPEAAARSTGAALCCLLPRTGTGAPPGAGGAAARTGARGAGKKPRLAPPHGLCPQRSRRLPARGGEEAPLSPHPVRSAATANGRGPPLPALTLLLCLAAARRALTRPGQPPLRPHWPLGITSPSDWRRSLSICAASGA